MKEKKESTEPDNSSKNISNENIFYQRLFFFLMIFAVIVIGAVNTQRKILFLSILLVGVIVCWAAAFILIRTSKVIDNKLGGRFVKLFLGYIIPVLCSSILTLALIFGSFGFMDKLLFDLDVNPIHIENKMNDVKNEVKKIIQPKADTSSKNFKNIDSMLSEKKSKKIIYDESLPKEVIKKDSVSKGSKSSKYFKSIETIVDDKKARKK
jgi:hypothetical protein